MSQLALPLKLADHAVFGSFVPAGNEALVDTLKAVAAGESRAGAYVWGGPASGKTHLLQAVCAEVGDRSAYLALDVAHEYAPELLDGLERRSVVCIDQLERIAGRADWERALFRLYNALQPHAGTLVVSAGMPLRQCSIGLADLESRLAQLPSFRLVPLGEADRAAALKLRAARRGLDLPDETARYLLTRSRRDMASLYTLLDTLDDESLRAQRKLTVPFVSDVLRDMGSA